MPYFRIDLIFNPNTNTASLVALVPTLSSHPEAADPEDDGPEAADLEYTADPEYADPEYYTEDTDLEDDGLENVDPEDADQENVGPPNIDPDLADKLKELTQVMENLFKEQHPEGVSETHSITEWCSLPNPNTMQRYINHASDAKLKIVLLLQFVAPFDHTLFDMHARWMHNSRIIFNPDVTWNIITQMMNCNHPCYHILPLYKPTLHDDHIDFGNDQKQLVTRINELIKTIQVNQTNSILQSKAATARRLSVVVGTHPHCGAASLISTLPPGILQQILEKAEGIPCGFFAQREVMPEIQLKIQTQSVALDDNKLSFLVEITFSLTRELRNAPNGVINNVIAETQNLASAFRELVEIYGRNSQTEIIEDISPHASNERTDQQLCLIKIKTTNTYIVDGLQKLSGHSPISTDPNRRSNISFREELCNLIKECETATLNAELLHS